ncbi:transmembrane protein 234 homolog [Mya arenaria]|uniref:transmembrane protein 234 homolog n=1 Tax=Mya arenaria TaxID=6604 RepID=UPI0022E21E32|nr:transmembrane protein 234 homolog [Mya arenaria]
MSTMEMAFWLVSVAFLWGFTNPFIKRGSKGIESIKRASAVRQLCAEMWFLITNWKYIIPFVINQSGSVLYYLTLASADLSLAVPITNSLTFIFTAISGHLLGEKVSSYKTVAGMCLVGLGVALCVYDKVS